jgi:predicted transcriptional regulator
MPIEIRTERQSDDLKRRLEEIAEEVSSGIRPAGVRDAFDRFVVDMKETLKRKREERSSGKTL